MPDPAARRLAETIATLEHRIAVLERSNPLLLGSAQGTVDLFDEDGDTRMQLGVHDDGVTGVVEYGGPVPATPVAPQVTSKNGVLSVFWRTGGRINLLPDPMFEYGVGGFVGAGGATVAQESMPLWFRSNPLPNPSFETNLTGWSAVGGTLSRQTSGGHSGAAFARLTASSATVRFIQSDVCTVPRAGEPWTVTGRLKGTPGRSAFMGAQCLNSGVFITTLYSGVITLTGAWQEVTFVTPALPATTNQVVDIAFMDTGSIGDVLDVDSMMMSKGTDGTYFDGDTPDDDVYIYSWVGTPHASESVQSQRYLADGYSLGITWQTGSSISRDLSDLPLIPGTVHTVSISVLVPTGSVPVTLTVSDDPDSSVTVGTDTTTRLAVTFVAGDTAPVITLTPSSATAGMRAWAKAALVEPAAAAGTYFDGDTPGYIWTGEPNVSASVAVENVTVDVAGAEVHLGDDETFTPNDDTYVGTITTLGASLTIPDRQPGDTHYVRLVLVTRAGVTSDASPATPTVVRPLSGEDIAPGTIGVGALDFDPADPGDGNPPAAVAAAPVVTGGIGALYVRWGAVTNPSRVLYDVHLSPTTGFTPGAGTLAGTTGGTVMSLRLDPGTALPLEYATTYYVKVVARDVDGSAAGSLEGSGTVIQVTGPDIAVETVAAENIIAGAITGRELSAEIILASLIRTAVAGRRVEVQRDSF